MKKTHISLYRKEGRSKRVIPQLLKKAGFTQSNKIDWGWDGIFLSRHAFLDDGILPYVRYQGVHITLVKGPVSRYSRATRNAWAICLGCTIEEVEEAISYM